MRSLKMLLLVSVAMIASSASTLAQSAQAPSSKANSETATIVNKNIPIVKSTTAPARDPRLQAGSEVQPSSTLQINANTAVKAVKAFTVTNTNLPNSEQATHK